MELQEESANGLQPEKPEKLKKLPHKNGRISFQKADLPVNAEPKKKKEHRYSNRRASQEEEPVVKAGRHITGKITATNAGHFEKADWQLALKRTEKKMNRYYKGEEVAVCCSLDHFKMYGPGIYLFFSFIKRLMIVFFIMSLVELAAVIYNYNEGNGLTNISKTYNYYFAKTTIASFDTSAAGYHDVNKLVNVIVDMVVVLIFLIFYFYWLYKSKKLTEAVRSQVKLRSYCVVELIQPPKDASLDDVKQFMGQFGEVAEVAEVKDYDETISLSKSIYNLEIQIKELELQAENEGRDDSLDASINEKKEKIDEIYKELIEYEDRTKQDILKYFVVFTDVEDKQKALKEIEPHMKQFCDCCREEAPENMKLCGQRVEVKACHTEPGDIIWENQHVTWKTRWMRTVCQYLCLLIILALGFLFICFLNVVSPASSSSTVNTDSYNETTIKSETNATIVESWCITNIVTVSGDSDLQDICRGYIRKYLLKLAMMIGIAVSAVIIKFIMRMVVTYLAKFQRYKSHTEQSKDIVQNLFIVYLFTTALITLLLQATISGVSFKQTLTYFIRDNYINNNIDGLSDYGDFLPNWYVEIGCQICLMLAVTAIHPALTMPFAHCMLEKIARCRAQGQEIQGKMQKIMEPEEFEIEDSYAEMLMVVFVSIVLSGGMPIIIIIGFFSVALRYIYLKYYFIKYCRIPKAFDEALDLKVSDMLPYGLLLHFMFAIWMFGVQQIFEFESSTVSDWVNGLQVGFFQDIASIIERLLGTWYYSAFFLFVVLIFIFKVCIYNMVAKRVSKEEETQEIEMAKVEKVDQRSGGFINVSSFSICDSYRIENNPDYTQILAIMHKKRKFVVKVKGNATETWS